MKKVVLVVGGGSGIGKKSVELLSDIGDYVFVADKDISRWAGNAGLGIICKEVDVLDNASLNNLVNAIKDGQLTLSGFVWTVGVAITKPVNSMKPSEYENLLQLNAIAFLNLLGAIELNGLFSQEGVSIVVISSLVASTGARGKIAYAASKGAIEAAIKSLAIEFAPRRIRVNAIAPGTVKTEMLDKLTLTIGKDAVNDLAKDYPLGLGEPEDVANLIAFLLNDKSQWMTGNVYILDGGFSSR